MENTEIMNNIEEVPEIVEEYVAAKVDFIKAGKVVGAVAGVAGLIYAGVKLGKKVIDAVKAKKKQKEEQDPFEGIDNIKGVDDAEE